MRNYYPSSISFSYKGSPTALTKKKSSKLKAKSLDRKSKNKCICLVALHQEIDLSGNPRWDLK